MRKKNAEIVHQELAQCRHDDAACALDRLIGCTELSDELRSAASAALASGFTLCHRLPHVQPQLLDEWLGGRWWLAHKSLLARSDTWSALVSSRLDRAQPDFTSWPQRIEQAIRSLARDRRTLLLAAGTMAHRYCAPLAQVSRIDSLRIQVPAARSSIAQWLSQSLTQTAQNKSVAYATLCLSPAEFDAAAAFESLPLADRASIAVAHQVMVLAVRAGGNMANLLNRRLQDARFPLGTVSIRLPGVDAKDDCAWLDRQAVGWYVPASVARQRLAHVPACHTAIADARVTESSSLCQLTTDIRFVNALGDYLVHCVRGQSLDAFCHGQIESVIDAIARGSTSPSSPLQTLVTVLESGRLRASGKLLRSGAQAVSLADVPLTELMARRHFQSHLGRWDWEPYGLMIRRDVLEQLGARPVIYGNEQLYARLGDGDRPFFQPARRRSARDAKDDWQAEREWRLLSDVHLANLPPGSLMLFVETAAQAQRLAAHYAWPVIYLEASRTRLRPTARVSRQRTSARTSRN